MGEARRRRAREAERHAALMAEQAERLRPPAEYAHMSVRDYWEMLEGEDPDDRAIREAHGFGYNEGWRDRALTCRYGCGATYDEISSGKMRTCPARRFGDEVLAAPSRDYCLTPRALEKLSVSPEVFAGSNAEEQP